MPSTRQLQVNSLLQQELSMFWEREIELPRDTIVSVARVEATPALDKAFVYVSVWPEDNESEVMDKLQKKIYPAQKYLDAKLSMRRVPQIVLEVDEQSASRREVEDILDSLPDLE